MAFPFRVVTVTAMFYEAWENEDRTEGHFSSVKGIAEHRASGLMPGEWRMLHRFEADSWEEAMSKCHDLMGYEPYKPMADSDIVSEEAGVEPVGDTGMSDAPIKTTLRQLVDRHGIYAVLTQLSKVMFDLAEEHRRTDPDRARLANKVADYIENARDRA